jgi:hypothetical protein
MNRALLVLFTSVLCASAPAQTINLVTITLTLFVQNTSTTKGTVTTTLAPVKQRAVTKDVLTYLAEDLNGEPSFGPGAQLALISYSPTEGYFAVVDKNLRLLADVSGILTFTAGENLISSGSQQSATGLAAPTLKGMQLATISYDGNGGYGPNAVQFSLQGMLSGSITDSTSKAGLVTETQTASVSSGTGEGTYNGIPFVVTGTWSLKGKSTQ